MFAYILFILVDVKSGVPLFPRDSLLFTFRHCFKVQQFLTCFIAHFWIVVQQMLDTTEKKDYSY